ncbi:MAG: M20/M25/M40 family metallo-hydrolase [Ornithinimicrobium sp.]
MSEGLVAAAQQRLPQMLADLERVITLETPSHDHAAVARGAAEITELLNERLGMRPEVIERDGVTHLRLRFGRVGDEAPRGAVRVLVLAHQDTVWPHGTLDRLPFSTDDGILRGPGSFDMLTGLVMAIHAVALLREEGSSVAGLSLLVTGDEEVGSATSRDLIIDEVAGKPAVLVCEASAEGGAVKVGRKGASHFRVTVYGKAAHAGLEPEAGVNATMELAHQVQVIAALADEAAGTSVVPTTMAAGSSSNTVPASAYVDVDSRARTEAEQRRIDRALRSLTPHLSGARIEIDGGIDRPPLQGESSAELYAVLGQVCRDLEVPTPPGVEVGGASDGNITAGHGAPTLDGLGAVGAGAHADHEHAIIDEIPVRTAILAAMIRRLLAHPLS